MRFYLDFFSLGETTFQEQLKKKQSTGRAFFRKAGGQQRRFSREVIIISPFAPRFTPHYLISPPPTHPSFAYSWFTHYVMRWLISTEEIRGVPGQTWMMKMIDVPSVWRLGPYAQMSWGNLWIRMKYGSSAFRRHLPDLFSKAGRRAGDRKELCMHYLFWTHPGW